MAITEERKGRKWAWAGVALLLLTGLSYVWAVGASSEPGLQTAKRGVVLDVDTGKPIAGVYVVVRWQKEVSDPTLIGHGNGGTQGSGCVYRTFVKTDTEGRYAILPTKSEFSLDANLTPTRAVRYLWEMAIYTPGYSKALLNGAVPGDRMAARGLFGHPLVIANKSGVDELEPVLLEADRRPEQRSNFLLAQWGRFSCEPMPDSHLSFARELYADARQTTCAQGGQRGGLKLVELRNDLGSLLPPLDPKIAQEIATIDAKYPPPRRYPHLISPEDGQAICDLLKPADEGAP